MSLTDHDIDRFRETRSPDASDPDAVPKTFPEHPLPVKEPVAMPEAPPLPPLPVEMCRPPDMLLPSIALGAFVAYLALSDPSRQ